MEAVFSRLVHISLMANWLIFAVIVLRMLLKKTPRRMICILWAIVALRLMLPFSIESPVSLIPQTTSAIQEAVDTSLIHPETIPAGTVQAPIQAEVTSVPERNQPRPSVLPIIWCIGSGAMLAYLFFSYAEMRRLVREAIPETENIWLCDAVTTPFILGLLRPRIYLPSGVAGETREYVLAHEQGHLDWKDHWWKPLAFVLLSIYWFDPFVWAAYALVCRDIEFACDERVIRRFDFAEKKAYSAALLACSTGKRLVLACPVAFGETAVVRRVRKVLHYRKPKFWVLLVSGAVVLVTAIGFLTVPETQAVLQESGLTTGVPDPTLPPVQTQPTVTPATAPEETDRSDEWADYPDGIQIELYEGKTFTAYIMTIRDPAKVFLETASDSFSMESHDKSVEVDFLKSKNGLAAINASYFFDDGSDSSAVGSVPCGLTLSQDQVVWDALQDMVPEKGFVGFNTDNILIVSDSMTADKARQLAIRDGCAGGPVLMVNGKPNVDAYNMQSGYIARTAIGQRSDGAVLFLFADGRTSQSLGATYADLIDILAEYQAVNACALRGGYAANLFYRDTEGRYGEKGCTPMPLS